MDPLRPTILIADDDHLVVRTLAKLATMEGLSFIYDTGSTRVVELAAEHRPEVVILDINQHIDGRDILHALKRDSRTCDLKVVVLTAVDDEFARTLCYDLGADDFQLKPFDGLFMTRVARMARNVSAAS